MTISIVFVNGTNVYTRDWLDGRCCYLSSRHFGNVLKEPACEMIALFDTFVQLIEVFNSSFQRCNANR